MKRRGFTLTEMLVVIGMIVLLIGMLAPMVTRSWRAGDRIRTAADLQAISAALDAYRQDHGDYPTVDIVNGGIPTLGKALSAPGNAIAKAPAASGGNRYAAGSAASAGAKDYVAFSDPYENGTFVPPPDPRFWVAYSTVDGADGQGFRTRGTSGRIYGPYIDIGKFMTGGNAFSCGFRDRYGRPILYYRANKSNVRDAGGFVRAWDYVHSPTASIPRYNANDNIGNIPAAALSQMLGDTNANGMIDGTEQPKTELPFLLWSAGPDEVFGPDAATTNSSSLTGAAKILKAVEKSDDVTNFRY